MFTARSRLRFDIHSTARGTTGNTKNADIPPIQGAIRLERSDGTSGKTTVKIIEQMKAGRTVWTRRTDHCLSHQREFALFLQMKV
jgi:hypothetical protein